MKWVQMSVPTSGRRFVTEPRQLCVLKETRVCTNLNFCTLEKGARLEGEYVVGDWGRLHLLSTSANGERREFGIERGYAL